MGTSENPQFAVIYVGINGDGEVVDVKDSSDNPLLDDHYDANETRRIPGTAMLTTENRCRWKLVRGVWMCIPVS